MKNEVLNKINEMLKEIKEKYNLKELEFDVDQISQEYIIITISYKGELYECNYSLELDLNDVKEDTYKILTSEIKEFYDKARKADNILMSIRDEILKLLGKFIDHIPENVEIILDTTDDMEVYEAYIEFKDVGVTIALEYFYYKNKLKLHSINISANNADGVKEAHELLEHIIHYFLVKKQLKNITS